MFRNEWLGHSRNVEREMARAVRSFLTQPNSTIEQRVQDIELVPGARVGFIHGRLTENQLENILYDFF